MKIRVVKEQMLSRSALQTVKQANRMADLQRQQQNPIATQPNRTSSTNINNLRLLTKTATKIINRNMPLFKAIVKKHSEMGKENITYRDIVELFRAMGVELPNIPGGVDIDVQGGKPVVSLTKGVSLGRDTSLVGGVKGGEQGAVGTVDLLGKLGNVKYDLGVELDPGGVKKAQAGARYRAHGYSAGAGATYDPKKGIGYKADLSKQLTRGLDLTASAEGDKEDYRAGLGIRGTFEGKLTKDALIELIREELSSRT